MLHGNDTRVEQYIQAGLLDHLKRHLSKDQVGINYCNCHVNRTVVIIYLHTFKGCRFVIRIVLDTHLSYAW
jgi:hypothetical protein